MLSPPHALQYPHPNFLGDLKLHFLVVFVPIFYPSFSRVFLASNLTRYFVALVWCIVCLVYHFLP